ncbi:Zn-ribbon domain-containing OB-fold protein [Streptomyces sp. NPDC008238]
MDDRTLDAHDASVDGGLLVQRCRWCGNTAFQRLLCPTCASTELDEIRSDGTGVIVSSMRDTSLVDLSDGFSVRGRVVGASPTQVRDGARVRLARTPGDEAGGLLFELCEPPASRYAW